MMIEQIKQLAYFKKIVIDDHTELSGGRCNQAIRLHTSAGDLVCVIQQEAADIKRQSAIHQKVSELKACPPILASELIDGHHFTVMKYIKGRHQSAHLWRKEKRQAFAEQLSQIHQLYHKQPNDDWARLDLAAHIMNYQNQLSAQNQALNRQSIDYLLPKLADLDTPILGLCHNDLNPKNLLTESEQQIIILDWEYAAIGDVYFDLACFVVEHQLTTTQTDQWLQDYWQAYNQGLSSSQAPHTLDVNKFKLYQQSYQLVCDLWHQIYSQ